MHWLLCCNVLVMCVASNVLFVSYVYGYVLVIVVAMWLLVCGKILAMGVAM